MYDRKILSIAKSTIYRIFTWTPAIDIFLKIMKFIYLPILNNPKFRNFISKLMLQTFWRVYNIFDKTSSNGFFENYEFWLCRKNEKSMIDFKVSEIFKVKEC